MSSSYYQRASARANSFAKELDFQFFVYQNEELYPIWWSKSRTLHWLRSLTDDTFWNLVMGAYTLTIVVLYSMDYVRANSFEFYNLLFNIMYGTHVSARFCNDIVMVKEEKIHFCWMHWIRYIIDLSTYLVFIIPSFADEETSFILEIIFCYIRLGRAFEFMTAMTHKNFQGGIIHSLFKYMYIFACLRIVSANMFIWLGEIKDTVYDDPPPWLKKLLGRMFFRGFYVVHKLFILIGPDSYPRDDMSRVLYMIVMIMGCLLFMGLTVASLALIIALNMRPEEIFRLRFRLIMNDMRESQVPTPLRDKVETFYRMYWHKQKAVSVTQLLPIFPPTLPSVIHTNIYFKAQQKSRVLRDLSYQFLSEVAKYMETIHYIPGDTIIKRNSPKSSIIYISYGDVEMLSAEDDDTALLRFTRGTIINPCGACIDIACTRSHLAIRAATFCTAHVLKIADLWKVAIKQGKNNGQAFIVHSSFEYHLERVKKHYGALPRPPQKYKSNIIMLKRNLIDLKEARNAKGKLLLERSDLFIEISGCYLMRNRADSSLMEDSDAICLRNTFPCILQPNSSVLLTWDIFVAATTFAVAIAHPYNLVYLKSVSATFKFFDFMVTLIYVTDIVVHLSTGTKIEEGVPITFTQTSSQQMQSYWFILDLISTLPILLFIGKGHFAGMNKLCKLPKMFRVLRHMEDICVYQSHAIRFMSYYILINILCYLVAALQQGYWCFTFDYCIVKNITEPPFWVQEPLDDASVKGRVMFSMYWSISMITFTSHKTAQVNKELWHNQLFVMIILEACTVIHIMVEASYSATIMVTDTMSVQYNTCIETVKNFLVKNNVDPVLRHRFINYLQLCWYTDKAFSITHKKTSILFDLPPHVYQDILAMQRSKYILCLPFMKFLNNVMLKDVSSRTRLFYTSPNEILLNTGDISNELYVIKQGFCEVVDPITKNVVNLISSKDHFGDVECLLRIPAYNTIRAVTHVQIFSISRKHLKEAIETPKIKDAINFAKQQPEYVALQTRREPFLCYEIPPEPPNRQKFPLPRKYEPDSNFLQPFSKLGFFAILRYVFPRFTIRPDGKYLKRYEWFRVACALVAASVYPLYTFLQLQWPRISYLTFFLDCVAFYDIFQRMLIGYFDKSGILVYHPASTAAHYIKGAFIVDLLASVPLELLNRKTSYHFENNAYRQLDTYQYFMYNRLLQLYRLPHALEILNDYIDRQDITLIIKAFPLFVSLLALVTSFIMGYSVEKWSIVDGGWFLKIKFDPQYGSWIEANADAVRYNITETPWNLMLTTYYWVVYETTTTGFNLFQPSQLSILFVLILCMLLGAMINTYFAVRVISIRSNVNQALADFQDHIKDIAVFMKKEKLSKEIHQEVMSYYEYNWDKMGGTNYRNVLKLCDQITLRTDAILHIYGPTFTECPILQQNDLALLRIIGRAVNSLYFIANMTIIERDDVISQMYFVDYGIIEVRDHVYDSQVVTTLPRGSAFGNLERLKTIVCPNKFVASSNVHLLQINAEIFSGIINEFPNVKTLMKEFRPHKENYIKGSQYEMKLVLSGTESNIARRQWMPTYFTAHSTAVQRFIITVSILCVYGDLYNAGFQKNDLTLISVLYSLDFCFLLKVIIMFFQPLATEEESLSRAVFMSRRKYVTTELKYDIVSCIPSEVLCLLSNNPWALFSFLRLNRLFRVITVYNSLKRIQRNLFINLTLYTIQTVFIWFTLFVHSVTCIWNLLGIYEDFVEPKSSWRYHNNKTVLCDSYICSVYFVLTTFTQNGVGDILPRKQSEVAFVSILMILSTMIFMIYVGEFSNIIQFKYFRFFSYYTKYIELREFLNNNRVSENLVKLAQKYTLHLWNESRGQQIPEFLISAPQCLRLKIMSAAYMHHLTQHPIFHECEPAFLRHLVGYLQPFIYDKNMYVVKEGEITNAMYFIHKGQVDEIDEEFEEKTFQFKTGEHFGWMNGLQYDVAYQYSYKSAIKSQVLTLCLSDWEYLLKHFPNSYESISNFRRSDSQSQGTQTRPSRRQSVRASFRKSSSTKSHPTSEKNLVSKETIALKISPSSDVAVAHSIQKTFSGVRTVEHDSETLTQNSTTEHLLPSLLPVGSTHISAAVKIEHEQGKLPLVIEDLTYTEEGLNSANTVPESEPVLEENPSPSPKETINEAVQTTSSTLSDITYPWPLNNRQSVPQPTPISKNEVKSLDSESSLEFIHPITKDPVSSTQLPTLSSYPDEKERNIKDEMETLALNNRIDNVDDIQKNDSKYNSEKVSTLETPPIAPDAAQAGSSKYNSALLDNSKIEDEKDNVTTVMPTKSDNMTNLEEVSIHQTQGKEQLNVSKPKTSLLLEHDSSKTSKHPHVHYKDSESNKKSQSEATLVPAVDIDVTPRNSDISSAPLELQRRFSSDQRPVREMTIRDRNLHSLDSDMPGTPSSNSGTTENVAKSEPDSPSTEEDNSKKKKQ